MKQSALLSLFLLATACGGPVVDASPAPAPAFVEVAPTALTLVDDGPFAHEEGAPVVACGAGGVLVEGSRVEVRTAYCDPADLALVVDEALPAGTMVDLTLSHDALVADGGEAHLAVTLGDEVVWEERKPLPAPAAFLSPRVPLVHDHKPGERLVVHVHNHGSNTYALHALSLSAP